MCIIYNHHENVKAKINSMHSCQYGFNFCSYVFSITIHSIGTDCNFEFRFGPAQPTLRAHSLILRSRSPYFHRLLENKTNITHVDCQEFDRDMVDLVLK